MRYVLIVLIHCKVVEYKGKRGNTYVLFNLERSHDHSNGFNNLKNGCFKFLLWFYKRSRTGKSSIRMCWYHMLSEASVERFMFRARATPSCSSKCEEMHFHVHPEKPETVILTVTSRVFDRCTRKFICVINHVCALIVLG